MFKVRASVPALPDKPDIPANYPRLLAEGYRIDSGPVESFCKNVVQARMKCVGMRWGRPGACAMLEVRCALLSDCWEDLTRKCA